MNYLYEYSCKYQIVIYQMLTDLKKYICMLPNYSCNCDNTILKENWTNEFFIPIKNEAKFCVPTYIHK